MRPTSTGVLAEAYSSRPAGTWLGRLGQPLQVDFKSWKMPATASANCRGYILGLMSGFDFVFFWGAEYLLSFPRPYVTVQLRCTEASPPNLKAKNPSSSRWLSSYIAKDLRGLQVLGGSVPFGSIRTYRPDCCGHLFLDCLPGCGLQGTFVQLPHSCRVRVGILPFCRSGIVMPHPPANTANLSGINFGLGWWSYCNCIY